MEHQRHFTVSVCDCKSWVFHTKTWK